MSYLSIFFKMALVNLLLQGFLLFAIELITIKKMYKYVINSVRATYLFILFICLLQKEMDFKINP